MEQKRLGTTGIQEAQSGGYKVPNIHHGAHDSSLKWMWDAVMMCMRILAESFRASFTRHTLYSRSWGWVLSSYCTLSDWASSDFKLLVTFFNSSSRSPDLLSGVRQKEKRDERKQGQKVRRTVEKLKPQQNLRESCSIFYLRRRRIKLRAEIEEDSGQWFSKMPGRF